MSLASMFREATPQDVIAETVPAVDSPEEGIAYLEALKAPKEALVEWLLRGNETAEHRLIEVETMDNAEMGRIIDETEGRSAAPAATEAAPAAAEADAQPQAAAGA